MAVAAHSTESEGQDLFGSLLPMLLEVPAPSVESSLRIAEALVVLCILEKDLDKLPVEQVMHVRTLAELVDKRLRGLEEEMKWNMLQTAIGIFAATSGADVKRSQVREATTQPDHMSGLPFPLPVRVPLPPELRANQLVAPFMKLEILQPLYDLLSQHHRVLQHEDPECTVVVRQIARLGSHCREVLKRHFSQYGEVSRVLSQQSMVKPSKDSRGCPRRRPGGLGVVIMRSKASAERILEDTPYHFVSGQVIQVVRFDSSAWPVPRSRLEASGPAETRTLVEVHEDEDQDSSDIYGPGSIGSTESSDDRNIAT